MSHSIGLMYYDESKETLEEKINKYMLQYKEKVGVFPTRIQVNSEYLKDETSNGIGEVEIEYVNNLPVNYFYASHEDIDFQDYQETKKENNL